jgi:exonuclease III
VRLVTWNCNGAFRHKFERLDAIDADILVIQECEDPAQSTPGYRAWAGDHAWKGNDKNKGIGVFPRRGQCIERHDWAQGEGGLFLPVRLGGELDVLAVWTLGRKSPFKFSYIAQFWHYLQLNRCRLGPQTVICGDFNSNQIWDEARRVRNHSDCIRELAESGFQSLYHRTTGEASGQERQPTFFLHRKEERPYHIDYVFAHEERLHGLDISAAVGIRSDWIGVSDHMPLVVDLQDRPDRALSDDAGSDHRRADPRPAAPAAAADQPSQESRTGRNAGKPSAGRPGLAALESAGLAPRPALSHRDELKG